MRRGTTVLMTELVALRVLKETPSPIIAPHSPSTKAGCLGASQIIISHRAHCTDRRPLPRGGGSCLPTPFLAFHYIQRMEIILPSLAWVTARPSDNAPGLPERPCDSPPVPTPVGRAGRPQMVWNTCPLFTTHGKHNGYLMCQLGPAMVPKYTVKRYSGCFYEGFLVCDYHLSGWTWSQANFPP